MKTLVFIGLLGVFAYHCLMNYKSFAGASVAVRNMLMMVGSFGYIAFLVLLVISFWHFSWWMPIVAFFASQVVGGLSAFLFQGNIVGKILSPVLVVAFAIASIVSL